MDDDATAPDEPTGDPYDDENATLIVRATGYGPDNTTVVLEALIAPLRLPSVVTNGDLDIAGNITLWDERRGMLAPSGAVHQGSTVVLNSQRTRNATSI